MEQPPDHEFADWHKFVLWLCKTIYGLKQSSQKWYEKLTGALRSLGFSPLEKDHGVFRLATEGELIILAIHVDDCTITGSSTLLIKEIQARISELFKVTLLRPINWLLGMEITWNHIKRTISLSQESYIDSVLQRFNITDCKSAATPMDPNIQLSWDHHPNFDVLVILWPGDHQIWIPRPKKH